MDAICIEVVVMGSMINGEGSVICTLINRKVKHGAHGCKIQLIAVKEMRASRSLLVSLYLKQMSTLMMEERLATNLIWQSMARNMVSCWSRWSSCVGVFKEKVGILIIH